MPRGTRLAIALLLILLASLFAVSSLLAQWEPDRRLTYNSGNSRTPVNNARCVAASGDTLHMVWHDDRDGDYEIYYKRSTDGGTGWSADARLTTAAQNSWYPSLATSGADVHVVWADTRDGNYEIYYKRSPDGGTSWEADSRLTNAPDYSGYPALAVSTQGDVHGVWADYREGNWEIYHKRSTDRGTSWGPDERLTDDPGASGYPSVAVSGTDVHVVWFDDRDGNEEVYHKRSTDRGASWGADERLTHDPGVSGYPSLAVSGTDVHVVWFDDRDGNEEIYHKRSTDGGMNWGADVRLTSDSSFSEHPSVAVSGPNAHLVWEDGRNGYAEIYYKGSTDRGGSWGADVRLTNAPDYSRFPSVAASGTKVHAVWEDVRSGNPEIFYKRNPTGNIGVEEEMQNANHKLQIAKLQITPNPFANFTTVNGHEGERFSLFDVSGRKVGTYWGGRVGEGLAPGVYFLQGEADRFSRPLKVIKTR